MEDTFISQVVFAGALAEINSGSSWNVDSSNPQNLILSINGEVIGRITDQMNTILISTERIVDEIPHNSESVKVDDAVGRFRGAEWFEDIQTKTVLLGGVGGIGSFTALLLSRVKPQNIIMYDPDKVERVNLSGQMFSMKDMDKYKVDAIADTIRDFSDYFSITAVPQRIQVIPEGTDIMISGFDNMVARSEFFQKWKKWVKAVSDEHRRNCLFIDGRLNAEEFQVFCMRGDDEYNIRKYESEKLFDDSQADETVCSYRQTTYTANMIASVIVNLFINFVANQSCVIPRDLPFYTYYDAKTMYFKTES